MNTSEIYKAMLSKVYKLLQLYFTFPVTTAAAERSFLSLQRIRTFLRSSMSDCRLNNLFLLHVHTSRTDALDLSVVAKKFVSVNSRRMNYFGKMLFFLEGIQLVIFTSFSIHKERSCLTWDRTPGFPFQAHNV